MIVVDNSALVAALVEASERGAAVRQRIAGEEIGVPDLIDLELAHSLRGLVRGRKLSAEVAERVLREWTSQDLDRFPSRALIGRVWELRDNLTAYDAVYIALAEALSTTLVTSDTGIAGAPGLRCAVELIT